MTDYAYVSDGIKLVVDGQSFAYAPTFGTGFPQQLLALLPARYRMDVVATSATTYAQRAVTAPRRVDQRVSSNDVSVLIDCGGMSDIIATAGNLTAAQTISAMESYWDARRTAGFDYIIAATVTKASSAWLDADGETQRQALNPLILASTHVDGVADLAALPHAADPLNTTYFYDELHPTVTLGGEFAVLYVARAAALGLPT